MKPLVIAGATAVILFALALAASIERYQPLKRRARPPVIVISIASLNPADALSAKMPSLNTIAAYGVAFTRATTCIPDQLAANATLLTGVYPEVHGLGLTPDARLPDSVCTLAELFQGRGYDTAAFVASDVLAVGTGLERGFDRFDVFGPPFSNRQRGAVACGRTALETVNLGLNWLEQRKGNPAFLFLQLNDLDENQPIAAEFTAKLPKSFLQRLSLAIGSNLPTRKLLVEILSDKPRGLSAADRAILRSLYDRAVECTDRALGTLFMGLKRMKMLDACTIVVCGDRSEPVLVRSAPTGTSLVAAVPGPAIESDVTSDLLQESVSIPLILKQPAGSRRVVTRAVGMAQNVDVVPTLIEMCELAPRQPPQGVSLLPLVKHETPLRQTAYYQNLHGALGFRRGQHKLITSDQQVLLFDLNIDPEEHHDLVRNPLHEKLFAKPWLAKGHTAEALKMMDAVRKQVIQAGQSLQADLARFRNTVLHPEKSTAQLANE